MASLSFYLRSLLSFLCILVCISSHAVAREQIAAEDRDFSFSGNVALCDSSFALLKIKHKFARTESKFWDSDVSIDNVYDIKEISFRPDGMDLIPRRYCEAMVTLNNSQKVHLRYAIIEDIGVQFCVENYDRNRTAPPYCQRLDR